MSSLSDMSAAELLEGFDRQIGKLTKIRAALADRLLAQEKDVASKAKRAQRRAEKAAAEEAGITLAPAKPLTAWSIFSGGRKARTEEDGTEVTAYEAAYLRYADEYAAYLKTLDSAQGATIKFAKVARAAEEGDEIGDTTWSVDASSEYAELEATCKEEAEERRSSGASSSSKKGRVKLSEEEKLANREARKAATIAKNEAKAAAAKAEREKAKAVKDKAKAKVAKVKKTSAAVDSDDDEPKSKSKPKSKKAKPAADSDSEDEKPKAKKTPKKVVKAESDSEEEAPAKAKKSAKAAPPPSDSEEEASTPAKAKKPAKAPAAPKKAAKPSSDDSESEAPSKKSAKKPSKKADSDSEEEAPKKSKKPVKKADSDSEEEKPAKKAKPAKKVVKAESDSEEEKPVKKAKKQVKVEEEHSSSSSASASAATAEEPLEQLGLLEVDGKSYVTTADHYLFETTSTPGEPGPYVGFHKPDGSIDPKVPNPFGAVTLP